MTRTTHTIRRSAPAVAAALLAVAMVGCQTAEPVARVDRNSAVGTRYAVATVNPLTTRAAVDAFEQGGNAVDAAVAAALTLGVVDSHNSGVGGGCFILIRTARGELLAIDGRETAPAAATPDMYHDAAGKPDPSLSQTGPLAVGTPGALAAYAMALEKAGKLPLARVIRPAADLAERGFAVDAVLADRIESTADDLRRFPGAAAIFLHADGSPLREGETLRQPDLAATYRAIADEGVAWFYKGPFARRIARWMGDHGGRLAYADFAGYEPRVRTPVESTYRGYRIVGFPPPSSGGVHVAQILNVLERFELAELHAKSPADFAHVIASAMKLAFADRAHWLGDPDFAEVPRGLIDKKYAADLAARIAMDRAPDVPTHGEPPQWKQDHFGRHTTHIATADAAGNWVAITATINTSFGSKVVVPGTGVVLNNEMDDFALAPGVPNAFGLVGAAANRVEPGKRPLSSMSPTIVFDAAGRPVMTLGAAGGPRIISEVLLAIVNRIDLGMPVDAAIGAPRLHHQWKPDVLYIEPPLLDAIADDLRRRGHKVEPLSYAGVTQAITHDPATGEFRAAHDPRVPGSAAAR